MSNVIKPCAVENGQNTESTSDGRQMNVSVGLKWNETEKTIKSKVNAKSTLLRFSVVCQWAKED